MPAETRLIALDWGTSSFRAHRIDAGGRVIETRRTNDGILSVDGRAFEAKLRDNVGDWLDARIPVIASGMITSRNGWVETPYVACPATFEALARGLVHHRLADGLEIAFVPGVRTADGIRDVIRGEEVQILGIMDAGLAVQPGTHSKWARVETGAITQFVTFMTGEIYAVLLDHSILGRLAEGRAHDAAAFRAGVDAGAEAGRRGTLTHALFGGRSLALAESLPPAAVASYVSGILIGCELEAAPAAIGGIGVVPHLFGDRTLTARYREAFDILGRKVDSYEGDATIRGLVKLAKSMQWL